ncbi:MAG TPA: YqgE/AlgH family protein [Terriglobales bacterium]|nr:YqgE/AlgH family protein [Terriglobales bacterium]
MSLNKLCLLAALVVVAFAAVPRIDFRTSKANIPALNSRSHHPAVAPDASPWYMGRSSNELGRSDLLFPAKTGKNSSVFLPVQSQNPDNLAAGKLLVASRDLGDPNFAETVILLVHYDADGAVGLVLNRRTNVPLSRVLEQLAAAKGRSDPVYLGGPVDTPAVFALLRSKAKPEGAEQVLSGVYWISTKATFEKAISGRPDPGSFHVYLGYAGWTNEQLRMEVELGSWFIFQGDAKTVFASDPDSLWEEMIQRTELQVVESAPHALERCDPKREPNERVSLRFQTCPMLSAGLKTQAANMSVPHGFVLLSLAPASGMLAL